MGLMNKFNKGSINWGVDTKDMPYIKLSDLKVGEERPIRGLFINSKGNFDAHPVAIVNNTLIDLPSHLTDTVNEIVADQEAVEAIKAGKVGIKVREYTAKKYNRECKSVEWIDI